MFIESSLEVVISYSGFKQQSLSRVRMLKSLLSLQNSQLFTLIFFVCFKATHPNTTGTLCPNRIISISQISAESIN